MTLDETWTWDAAVASLRSAPADPHFTVYVLFDLREPTRVRYVGMTNSLRRRYAEHCCLLRGDSPRVRWIKEMKAGGAPIGVRVAARFADKHDAMDFEQYAIEVARRNGHGDLNLEVRRVPLALTAEEIEHLLRVAA